MGTVLISACPYDTPTEYGYFYLRKAADVLANYGHKVVFLRNANLDNFRKALINYNPKFVVLNGHGGSKAVTGCGHNVILGVCSYDEDLKKTIIRENPHWMEGRIVFLFTCNTGKELAGRLFEEGAAAVAAFKRDYIFVSQDSSPAKDERAYASFMAPIQLVLSLAEGKSFKSAVEAMRDAFLGYVEEAEAKGDVVQAKYLNYNLENLVVYGDGRI